MLLFTRESTIRPGKLGPALQFVNETTARVGKMTDTDFAAYVVVFGAPNGTIVWATMYESIAEQAEVMTRLMGDPDYMKMVEPVGDLFQPGSFDMLREVIHQHGQPQDDWAAFVSFTTATVAPGKISEAVTWGAQTLDYLSNAVGLHAYMTRDLYGNFAQLSWVMSADDADALDTARAKLQADPGYMERIDRAGVEGLFMPGSGRTSLSRRIV